MHQEQIAGIILGVISLFLILAPKAVWKVTESWKNKGQTEPSDGYLVVVRLVGTVFIIVSIGLIIYRIVF